MERETAKTSLTAYRDYVTSASFNMTLSKHQIYWLAHYASGEKHKHSDEVRAVVGTYDPVGAGRALERRGLVFAPDPQWPGIKKLTKPGKLVLELLKCAGLVMEHHQSDETA